VTPIRLAVIGAGHLGRFHAKIAAQLGEVELVAVCDPLEDSRQRVAQEAGCRPIADFRDVVDQVDAAVLATPTSTHCEIGQQLLERGLSLLVEKPLAATVAEAEQLLRCADRQGSVLQVGHVERFNPAFTCVASKLTDPKYIEATRTSGYSFRSTDIGVVLDVMIHDLDIILALVDAPVTQVDAIGVSVLGDHEDMASARLTFATGCVAQLTASRISYETRRIMQVATTSCFASIDFANTQATMVAPREDVLKRELKFGEIAADEVAYWKKHMFDELLVKRVYHPPEINAIEEEQRDLVAAIQQRGTPQVDGVAGRNAVAVAELILDQIGNHGWDGAGSKRCGPLAMPASPILFDPTSWERDVPQRRKAG
jgi:predicted dehydrogenase